MLCSSSQEEIDTRKLLFMFLHIGRQSRPTEVPEGTDAEQTQELNKEEGEREDL